MEEVLTWLTSGGWDAIMVIVGLLLQIFATVATKFMTGPAQAKAISISDKLKLAARRFGIGQFKDEPGSWSAPLANGDSKLRIVEVKTKSLIPPANT